MFWQSFLWIIRRVEHLHLIFSCFADSASTAHKSSWDKSVIFVFSATYPWISDMPRLVIHFLIQVHWFWLCFSNSNLRLISVAIWSYSTIYEYILVILQALLFSRLGSREHSSYCHSIFLHDFSSSGFWPSACLVEVFRGFSDCLFRLCLGRGQRVTDIGFQGQNHYHSPLLLLFSELIHILSTFEETGICVFLECGKRHAILLIHRLVRKRLHHYWLLSEPDEVILILFEFRF